MKTISPKTIFLLVVSLVSIGGMTACSDNSNSAASTTLGTSVNEALEANSFDQCLRAKQSVDAINGKTTGLMDSDHVAQCKDETLSTKAIEAEAMKSGKAQTN